MATSFAEMPADAASASSRARFPWIDAARGVALAAMVVYHGSWDLRHFGFISVDVAEEPGWRIFARLIAGAFLALVGVGLVLATRRGFDRRRFLRRLAIIAAGAVAITVATWFAMPDEYIFFGMLHCIAVSSVLALPFLGAPILLVVAGSVFCFVAPALLAGPLFDWPPLLWLGLSSTLPRSNDFVPIFPWFGVVLAGVAVARIVRRYASPALVGLAQRSAPAPLVWAGRRSLWIYLLHQPLLFGVVALAAQIAPPDLRTFEGSYLKSCSATCMETGVGADICGRTCGCLAERTQAEGLWTGLMRNSLSDDQISRYYEVADECRANPDAGKDGS